MSDSASTARRLAAAPADEESARRAVAPCRKMSAADRMLAPADLLAEMDQLPAGRAPLRTTEDEDFWRRWQDPPVGRPR